MCERKKANVITSIFAWEIDIEGRKEIKSRVIKVLGFWGHIWDTNM